MTTQRQIIVNSGQKVDWMSQAKSRNGSCNRWPMTAADIEAVVESLILAHRDWPREKVLDLVLGEIRRREHLWIKKRVKKLFRDFYAHREHMKHLLATGKPASVEQKIA